MLRGTGTPRTPILIGAGLLVSLLLLFYSISFQSDSSLLHVGLLGRLRPKPDPVSLSSSEAHAEPHAPTVAVVAATIQTTNTSWIPTHFPTWSHHIYSVDGDPSYPLQAPNKGREASAYLTYILDNYHNNTSNSLTDYTIFTHDSRYDWHNDDPMYDAVGQMKRLNLSRVDEEGYINLRCTWKPGCDTDVTIKPVTTWDPEMPENPQPMLLYGRAMLELFPSPFWDLDPEDLGIIRNPCCAQFAVSKARILQLPRERYEAVHTFVREWSFRKTVPEVTDSLVGDLMLPMEDPAVENMFIGNIMENMWHILFGRPQDNCVAVGECYCRNLGVCRLDCADEGACEGHYWKPNIVLGGLPLGWPDEGQGEGGWPVKGWHEDVARRRWLLNIKIEALVWLGVFCSVVGMAHLFTAPLVSRGVGWFRNLL